MVKELEVKFRLNNRENIGQVLKRLGGKSEKPYRQTTYGFFSDDSIQKGIFPRLRYEFGKVVLTVKVKNLDKKTKYFERNEYSVKVSNLRAGIKILELLGYDKIRKFTKVRTNWRFISRRLQVSIDRLYFGSFIELEGAGQEIEKMIKDLGFQNRERITRAYLALEDEWKQDH